MSEKTVIECDGGDCCNEYEHNGGDFMICDITERGWLYIPEHETHYCKRCKPLVKAELGNDVEYIE